MVLGSMKPVSASASAPLSYVDLDFGVFGILKRAFLAWRLGCLARADAEIAGPLVRCDDVASVSDNVLLFRLKDGVRGVLMSAMPADGEESEEI